MSFLGEIKRRKVFQAAAVYAVIAWLIVQVADVVLPAFGAPPWVLQVIIFLLALGFPVALILSWAFELTAEGVVRDDGSSHPRPGTGRRLELVLAFFLVIAVAWIGFHEINPSATDAVLPNSVAVLPFENLSVDPENAFFAAGIHDTILHELVKIADMNVIARTSVLPYGDGQTPIPQIADELNVETVMEGTVQYAGNQVRITAQLIDPATGSHLWSGNYDRPFTDIFAIQSEIATRIAIALEAELLPNERASIENRSTNSTEAYELFLKAMVLFPGLNTTVATPEEQTAALNFLLQAVELDPGFALAHAHIGKFMYDESRGYDLSLQSIRRALELDPDLGFAYGALGRLHWSFGEYQDGLEAYETALNLTPGAAEILSQHAFSLALIGQIERAQQLNDDAVLLDSNSWAVVIRQSSIHLLAGRYAETSNASRRLTQIAPENNLGYVNLALAESLLGNFDVAEEYLRAGEEVLSPFDPGSAARIAYDYSRLGLLEDASRILAIYEAAMTSATPIRAAPTDVAFAELAKGNSEAAIIALQEARPGTAEMQLFFVHNVQNDPVLEQPDWLEFRDRLYVRI